MNQGLSELPQKRPLFTRKSFFESDDEDKDESPKSPRKKQKLITNIDQSNKNIVNLNSSTSDSNDFEQKNNIFHFDSSPSTVNNHEDSNKDEFNASHIINTQNINNKNNRNYSNRNSHSSYVI